jgi:hypothetical protein
MEKLGGSMINEEMVWAVNVANTNDWFEIRRAVPESDDQLFRCFYYEDSQNLIRTHYVYKTYSELMAPNAYRFYHSPYIMRENERDLDITIYEN